MKKRYILSIIVTVLILTGCWDQRLLKEVRLALCLGFDEEKDGKIVVSSIITRNLEKKPPALFTTEGETTRDTRINLQRNLTFVPDGSKNRIVLLSDSIAKRGNIVNMLDVFYRDPHSALNAKIAVVKGKTSTFLEQQTNSYPDLVGFLDRQIVTSEAATLAPDVDLQSIRTGLMDPGQDIMLPYIGLHEKKMNVLGGALFHDQKQTGVLSPKHTTIALLLADKKNKTATLTLPIKKGKHITVNVLKIKRKLNVREANGNIQVFIDLQMDVEAIEFPTGNFFEFTTEDKLDAILSKEMTSESEKVLQQLQSANCDVLGIGRRLIAFNHDYWSKTNWTKEYPKVKITPSVHVTVLRHGILN